MSNCTRHLLQWKLLNLLLEKGAFLMSHQTSSTFFINLVQVSFSSSIKYVCRIMRFQLIVSLSSLLVAIKQMRVPRQYWDERKVTNSEQGNYLFSLFPFLRLQDMRHEIKYILLWIYKFYTQWMFFRRFVSPFCGRFDRWSTSWFC